MDDTRNDSDANYGLNQAYGSSQLPKVSINNVIYTESQIVSKYVDEDDDEEDEEETNAGDNDANVSIQQNRDNDDDDNQSDDDDDEDHRGKKRNDGFTLQRHPKKRKLKSLLSSYEFAPRVVTHTSAPKPSFGGRNTLTDWTEHESFVLLEAWGERFLQCGRKSLRSEEWQEVADRVSQVSKIERTDSQCRNRLDTLKKKYKKEKSNLKGNKGVNTKWVYFKKMDMLLSSTTGDNISNNISMNPVVNPNNANGVDEARGSSGNSDSQEGDDDDSDLLPPKKLKSKTNKNSGDSVKLLADSINKFSEIYEKIENSKIQQMMELEKIRMDFYRDLELQKRRILDRARQGDYKDNDVSAENVSG